MSRKKNFKLNQRTNSLSRKSKRLDKRTERLNESALYIEQRFHMMSEATEKMQKDLLGNGFKRAVLWLLGIRKTWENQKPFKYYFDREKEIAHEIMSNRLRGKS